MGHMNTRQCLDKFSKTSGINEKDGHAYRKRNELSTLLGVNNQTGYELFSLKRMPGGERLFRLRLFLSLVGYPPAERENQREMVRDCADLVALKIVTVDQIHKHAKLAHSSIVRILGGRAGTTAEHFTLLQEIADSNKEVLLQKSQEWALAIKTIGLKVTMGKQKETSGAQGQGQKIQQEAAQEAETLKPLDKVTSREVAVSVLSSIIVQLGLMEKVANGASKEEMFLDGDRNRAIEVVIRLMKVFGISPQVLSRLRNPQILTENDPIFSTLNEFAKLATGKEKS